MVHVKSVFLRKMKQIAFIHSKMHEKPNFHVPTVTSFHITYWNVNGVHTSEVMNYCKNAVFSYIWAVVFFQTKPCFTSLKSLKLPVFFQSLGASVGLSHPVRDAAAFFTYLPFLLPLQW